jgi:hypothetical protein
MGKTIGLFDWRSKGVAMEGIRKTDALMKKLVQVPKSELKKPAKRKKKRKRKKK